MIYSRELVIITSEKDCKLCGKVIYQLKTDWIEFRICTNCYKISSGWVKLPLTKKPTPILYLPWWDTYNECMACYKVLKFKSDCQKWCSNCFIVYSGCRY